MQYDEYEFQHIKKLYRTVKSGRIFEKIRQAGPTSLLRVNSCELTHRILLQTTMILNFIYYCFKLKRKINTKNIILFNDFFTKKM